VDTTYTMEYVKLYVQLALTHQAHHAMTVMIHAKHALVVQALPVLLVPLAILCI
jgi:hypothetical protein